MRVTVKNDKKTGRGADVSFSSTRMESGMSESSENSENSRGMGGEKGRRARGARHVRFLRHDADQNINLEPDWIYLNAVLRLITIVRYRD